MFIVSLNEQNPQYYFSAMWTMEGIQIYQIVLVSLSASHLSSAAVPEPDNVAHPRRYRFAATSELGFGSLAYNCITDNGVHTWNH